MLGYHEMSLFKVTPFGQAISKINTPWLHFGLEAYSRITIGIQLVMDFPSGARPCHSRLPSPMSWPNCKLVFSSWTYPLRTSPLGPFLKPLVTDTYATHECCQTGSQTSPTFRLATQVVMGATPQRSGLGPQLGNSSHLRVCLEGHVN